MQKRRTVVIAAILIGVAVIVAGILLAIHFLSDKTESYRSILVYELEGSAVIERNGTETFNAVENLYLESGDRIKTAADSYMRLKLDDDKYIMVEEESIFRIEATGNKVDSKTSIYLEQGTITNEIQNKLNDKSNYEITTPNSVMAVRGTIFLIQIYVDENGDVYTKLSVFEGVVTTHLVYPDGTTREDVQIEAGKEVIIHSNDTVSEYLGDPTDIDYSNFSLQTLYILEDLIINGSTIEGISQEELDKMIQNMKNGDEYENDSEPTTESDTEPTTEPDTEPTTEPELETAMHTVTFLYEGEVFAIQIVEDGQTVMQPKLKPSDEGEWEFDFSQPIKEDTRIEWK